MNKVTFLPTIFLAVMAAIIPAQAVELVKAETIDNKALQIEANKMLSIEIQQMHVKIDTKQTVELVKNNLDSQIKATETTVNKTTNYAANLAE